MSEQILTKATGMFGIVVAILLICVGVYFFKKAMDEDMFVLFYWR